MQASSFDLACFYQIPIFNFIYICDLKLLLFTLPICPSLLSRPTDCYYSHVFNLSKIMNTLDIVALDNIYLCDMHFFYGSPL